MVFIPTPYRVPAIWRLPPDAEMHLVIHEQGGPLAFASHARELERELVTLARRLKCKPFEVADRITKLLAEIEANEATLVNLRAKLAP